MLIDMFSYIGECTIFGGKTQIDEDNWEMYDDDEVTHMMETALEKIGFICKKVRIKNKYDDLQYLVECFVEYEHDVIFDGHSQDFYLKGIKTFNFENDNSCLCEFTIIEKI